VPNGKGRDPTRKGAALSFVPLVVLAAVGCGGGVPADSGSKVVRPGGRIAFAVNRNGFSEIWTMSSTGTARVRLTRRAPRETDASGNSGPAWSPSGSQIAYVSSGRHHVEDERDLEIHVMGSDGRHKRRLTFNDLPDYQPAWSPDGRTIVFARAFDSGRGPHPTVALYEMAADGTDQRELARESPPDPRRGAIFLFDPAWSPDGNAIAYTRAEYKENSSNLSVYLMDADGSNRRKLADNAADPAWAPDGSRIAFVTDRDRFGHCLFHDCTGFAPEIYVMRADGTNAQRVTHSRATDVGPSWSPDGARIAFARIAEEEADYDIYTLRPRGTGVLRLTRTQLWDYQPAWQPATSSSGVQSRQ
jgi:TolB protein